MKKVKIYITFKQALIILIPTILLLIVFFNSNLIVGDLKKYLSLKSESFTISKEGLFQTLLINRDKINLYEKSLFEMDKNSTIWILKYAIFEYNIRKNSKGNLATYIALTKSINKRDNLIDNLNNENSQMIDKNSFFEDSTQKFIQEKEKENLNNNQILTLQMILISKKKSKVIINGKILTVGDKIGDSKIVKILEDRVLIKTSKEDRWLKLIN